MSTMRVPARPFFTIKRAPQTGYWYVCQDGHYVYDNDRVLECLFSAGILQSLSRGVFFRDPQLAAAVLRLAGFPVEVEE